MWNAETLIPSDFPQVAELARLEEVIGGLCYARKLPAA